MTLKDQVCSLELSKRLKELGVPQNSLFYWELGCDGRDRDILLKPRISSKEYHDTITGEWGDCHLLSDSEIYSAFTASELLEMLPVYTTGYNRLDNKYRISLYNTHIKFVDKNLSNACAKMLAYLLENKLITIDELVNKY